MKKIAIVFGIFLSCTVGLLYAQSLTQEQQQGAEDKIASDQAQINQIQQDEATLNAQYQAAYNAKDTQLNALESEVYLLNSWLNPPLASSGQPCTENSQCASGNCFNTSGVNWTAGTCQ